MLRFIAIYLLQVIRENSKSEIQSFKKGKISEYAQCLVFPIVYLISRGNCTFLINFDLLESYSLYRETTRFMLSFSKLRLYFGLFIIFDESSYSRDIVARNIITRMHLRS